MNGISFAALLGAGAWFGNLLANDDSHTLVPVADPGHLSPDPLRSEIPDDDGSDHELLWPSRLLFM